MHRSMPHLSTPDKAYLSIIIPAYNEEQGIGHVLDELNTLMPQAGLAGYEIIIVDDGSRDATAKVIRESGHSVHLIQHPVNRGYGAALKTGMRHAQYDLICITDADGTYPNERISDLIAELLSSQADMVVGARTGDNVAIPLVRRPAKWVIRKLAAYVANQPIPDLNSGLRVFKRSIARQMVSILPDGFSFTTTITLAMLTNNYLVKYLPIDYHARKGQSKIRPLRDTWNFTLLILKIGLYFAPMKVFLPISILLVLAGMVWGLFTTFTLGRFADASTMMLVLTGVQVAVIGLLAELVNHRLGNHYRDE